jgi:dihydrofolate reductase
MVSTIGSLAASPLSRAMLVMAEEVHALDAEAMRGAHRNHPTAREAAMSQVRVHNFHFVDAAPQEALDLARAAAGDLDVRLGGGPTVVRDFLAADLIDLLHVVQVPILLGRGVRLWDGVEGVEERYDVEAVSSPSGVTHLTLARR